MTGRITAGPSGKGPIMRRFLSFKDRIQKGSMETRGETFGDDPPVAEPRDPSSLRWRFRIIEGEEEMIPYPSRHNFSGRSGT